MLGLDPDITFWAMGYHPHPPSGDPEGGTGGPDPPEKSQVIWVSIGNKQLDPPPHPWKKLDPPPPWKMLDPLWNLEK